MHHKIQMKLDEASIDAALLQIASIKEEIMKRCHTYLSRLAEEGLVVSKAIFADHIFTGETLDSLTVQDLGMTETGHRFVLSASSKAILYFEFGAGVRYSGETHPKASELGMGAGTHSPKGHWNDPNGWWYPTDDYRLIAKTDKNGQGWGHSYGNPPYMPMYRASQAIIERAQEIAKEVFA